jgi:hypothetical protein
VSNVFQRMLLAGYGSGSWLLSAGSIPELK